MKKTRPHRHGGFTLVELMIVIAIIALLAGLLVVAVQNAVAKAKETAIKTELDQIALFLGDYRNKFGSPPPAFIGASEATNGFDNRDMVIRHLKKAFPRIQQSEIDWVEELFELHGAEVLTPAETLHFWLSGFSSDVTRPLTGPGGPWDQNIQDQLDASTPNAVGTFDKSRLEYSRGDNPNDAIRLSPPGGIRIRPRTYHPQDKNAPFVYFDTSRDYSEFGEGYVYEVNQTPVIRPYVRRTSAGTIEYVNPESFQLLSAGLDDNWGLLISGETPERYYPDGPFTGNYDGHGDNLANFSDRRLEDSQP